MSYKILEFGSKHNGVNGSISMKMYAFKPIVWMRRTKVLLHHKR